MQLNDLSGKNVLITGATNGIGLEAAVVLAQQGANVTIVGRDATRTAESVADIKARSKSGNVDSILCDFADFDSIRALAAGYRAGHDKLHVLINNAGSVYETRTILPNGIEATFAVNHLAYFLLTQLLSDLLVASAPARVVIVASTGHYRGTMDLDDLYFEKNYWIMRAYQRSKLGNVLYARSLAKRLEGKGVTVNALHPGGVATNIWTGAPAWTKPILAVVKWFMLTPAQGAERITYLAASPEVEGKSGGYYHDNREKAPSALAQDAALGEQLWVASEKLVGLAR